MLALLLLAAQAPTDLEILHINVGKGDATLIRGPADSSGDRVTVLVDLGDTGRALAARGELGQSRPSKRRCSCARA